MHTDANLAEIGAEGRSTSGRCTMLDGSLVDWRSQTQPSAQTNIAATEYVAMVSGVDDGLWACGFIQELGFRVRDNIVKIRCDNNAAMSTAINPGVSDKMKTVVAKFYHIRDAVEYGEVYLDRVDSRKNKADAFTKALKADDVRKFCKYHQLAREGALESRRAQDSDWENRATRARRGRNSKTQSYIH